MSTPSLTSTIIEAAEALDDHLKRSRPPFTTTSAIIDALGGVPAVAALTGSKPAAVSNWLNFSHFPSRFYALMLDALHERGLHAPASLWGMAAAKQHEAAETEVA